MSILRRLGAALFLLPILAFGAVRKMFTAQMVAAK